MDKGRTVACNSIDEVETRLGDSPVDQVITVKMMRIYESPGRSESMFTISIQLAEYDGVTCAWCAALALIASRTRLTREIKNAAAKENQQEDLLSSHHTTRAPKAN